MNLNCPDNEIFLSEPSSRFKKKFLTDCFNKLIMKFCQSKNTGWQKYFFSKQIKIRNLWEFLAKFEFFLHIYFGTPWEFKGIFWEWNLTFERLFERNWVWDRSILLFPKTIQLLYLWFLDTFIQKIIFKKL